jgi:hypothetical protein
LSGSMGHHLAFECALRLDSTANNRRKTIISRMH